MTLKANNAGDRRGPGGQAHNQSLNSFAEKTPI